MHHPGSWRTNLGGKPDWSGKYLLLHAAGLVGRPAGGQPGLAATVMSGTLSKRSSLWMRGVMFSEPSLAHPAHMVPIDRESCPQPRNAHDRRQRDENAGHE